MLEWLIAPAIRAQCDLAGLRRQRRHFSEPSMACGFAEVYEPLIHLGQFHPRKGLSTQNDRS